MGEETTSSAKKGTGPKGSFQSKESKYLVHLFGTKEHFVPKRYCIFRGTEIQF